jgi:NAD(P)H-dependent FMN reductase
VILAISGSLRLSSLNSAALRAAARAAARTGIEVALADAVRTLPPFDPDLEPEPPLVVRRFREACERADAVLLAVPEYAFGIPGAFKNALDWSVGSGALYQKPVAVLSVAPAGRGGDVRAALDRVLTALDCRVTHHSVPISTADLVEGEVPDGAIAHELLRVVGVLAALARSAGPQAAISDGRDT